MNAVKKTYTEYEVIVPKEEFDFNLDPVKIVKLQLGPSVCGHKIVSDPMFGSENPWYKLSEDHMQANVRVYESPAEDFVRPTKTKSKAN